MASQAKNIPEVGIDMTPMIDVVFQLLIFFMLVSHMVQLERAQLQLPEADQAIPIEDSQNDDARQLIINVHKDGRLEIAQSTISWEQLQETLEHEAQISQDADSNATRVVSIRADIEAPYRIIQRIMFECARKKIYRISFDAKKPDGK